MAAARAHSDDTQRRRMRCHTNVSQIHMAVASNTQKILDLAAKALPQILRKGHAGVFAPIWIAVLKRGDAAWIYQGMLAEVHDKAIEAADIDLPYPGPVTVGKDLSTIDPYR